MASRFAKVATAAVTGAALMTQIQLTSFSEKPPWTSPWFKGAGAEINVDQVGQQVKKTNQADGGVHIEGHPESLKTLEKISGNSNQYGLDAIKEFAAAQKETAAAAASAHKYAADAAANAQKETAATAANAQKETAATAANAQKETASAIKYAADAATIAQRETAAAAAEAQRCVAQIHKEEVLWLGAAGVVISFSGVAIIFMMKDMANMMKDIANSFMLAVKK
jgi:hypothetical protein